MSDSVIIIGIGADGQLTPSQRERVVAADFLAGGERHLAYFPQSAGRRFALRNNLDELADELERHEGRCVVLASGDPLFYGIGKFLLDRLGPARVRIEPAVSSMQLAFARAGLSWQDAALASIHGRQARPQLLPLLGRRTIGLFTQDGESPAAVARFFLAHGLPDYEAVVGENLGSADERVTRWRTLSELAEQRFAALNYLVLHRRLPDEEWQARQRRRGLVPGVPDEEFARPADGRPVMTRQEIRAVVLSKLGGLLQAGDTAWDIGAGLGTVAVEMAVLRPGIEVLAVERNAERAALLRQNRERFDAWNVRILDGEAPAVLTAEPEQPRLIFIGGSGQGLAGILNLAADRLLPGGRLLANFITLENLHLACQRLRGLGWRTDVTLIQVARSDTLSEGTSLKPLRGVYLLSADRSG